MRSKFEDYNFTHYEEVTAEEGLIKCYNGSYKCVSQTEALDDWLGPSISFLWFLFLCISAFSIRMIYKTFIKFRDTLTYRDNDDHYQFKGQSQIFKISFDRSFYLSIISPEVHRK